MLSVVISENLSFHVIVSETISPVLKVKAPPQFVVVSVPVPTTRVNLSKVIVFTSTADRSYTFNIPFIKLFSAIVKGAPTITMLFVASVTVAVKSHCSVE